jgi:hypothetical protein
MVMVNRQYHNNNNNNNNNYTPAGGLRELKPGSSILRVKMTFASSLKRVF